MIKNYISANSLKEFAKKQFLIIIFIIFVIILGVLKPSFMRPANLNNVLIDMSIFGLPSLAMCIALITGEFDLSLSSNFAWGQIFFCYLLNNWGTSGIGIFASFIVTVLSCMVFGCLNGLLVVKGRLNSFIATLSTMTIIRGICLVFTNSNMIKTSNRFITDFGNGKLLGISYLVFIFLIAAGIAHYMMSNTRFGRNLYATGGNYNSARIAGINVEFNKFIIFVILGMSAGIGGAMFISLIRAGSVLYGTDLGITSVVGPVIGGTAITGGRGNILKTVLGLLLINVIYKALAFLGLQGYYNTMIRGFILLAVVFVDAYSTSGNKTRKA